MPRPARIDLPDLLAAARQVLEEQGVEGVTMREVARRLGVAAPSLYFHVESRDDLLRELTAEGLSEFSAAMRAAANSPGGPRERIHALASAYIAFAEAHPQLFVVVFGPCPEERRVDEALAVEASAPVLELAACLVGEERALWLAETLWSLVHGYTVLRIAGQFRLNAEHEAGFRWGLDLFLDAALLATHETLR